MKNLLIFILPIILISCASNKKSSDRQWSETERIQTTETITMPSLTATLTRPPVLIADDTIRWADPVTGIEAKQYKDVKTGQEKLEVKVPEREAVKNTVSNIDRSGKESTSSKTKWQMPWWLFFIIIAVLLYMVVKFLW